MKQINIGIIGTGWCGGIRANTCAANPLVNELHIAETRPERLAEVVEQAKPTSSTEDYQDLLANQDIDAIIVSATPEPLHYPMALESMQAGKHVFLEKPIALTLDEADELIELSTERNLKFTIGYSQRFNPKFAYVKQSVEDGSLGEPVSAMVSRHITRNLGKKISGRTKLSPAAMEATHDIDFILWCLQPRLPKRVYCQSVYKVMKKTCDAPDCSWITVTMGDGVVFTIGAGWILPPSYPNFSSTNVEFVGSEGVLLIDNSHRDIVRNTMDEGIVFPLSTMPGEQVGHVFAGAMHNETVHFIEAVACDRNVMVKAEEARQVMEVYLAADLSAARNEPVSLPLSAKDTRESLALSEIDTRVAEVRSVSNA